MARTRRHRVRGTRVSSPVDCANCTGTLRAPLQGLTGVNPNPVSRRKSVRVGDSPDTRRCSLGEADKKADRQVSKHAFVCRASARAPGSGEAGATAVATTMGCAKQIRLACFLSVKQESMFTCLFAGCSEGGGSVRAGIRCISRQKRPEAAVLRRAFAVGMRCTGHLQVWPFWRGVGGGGIFAGHGVDR